ncbi:thermonuclease family protein [Thalassobaculum litoreum]|uniref:Nuclease homologue n=1 Tax=Thalassobaculum litoreum DSM 18839 TaxID=1123362 RepID=A0A8G2BIN2_9PROT|nr:thermonuclease family protein [Thalassobaculum litoreum]SDF83921.1 nuclease homologue [Thalassobaculum litoreum DSM 18839]
MRYLLILLCLIAAPAVAEPWTVKLRSPAAYDADTLYVLVPSLPESLQRMSIRVMGIDAPEIRGKCEREKVHARAARDFVLSALKGEEVVTVDVIGWDKYGGRIDAHVALPDGRDLGTVLVRAGLARVYDGGARRGWCD